MNLRQARSYSVASLTWLLRLWIILSTTSFSHLLSLWCLHFWGMLLPLLSYLVIVCYFWPRDFNFLKFFLALFHSCHYGIFSLNGYWLYTWEKWYRVCVVSDFPILLHFLFLLVIVFSISLSCYTPERKPGECLGCWLEVLSICWSALPSMGLVYGLPQMLYLDLLAVHV